MKEDSFEDFIDSRQIKKLWNRYKNMAKKRNLIFRLTKGHFAELITDACFYCGKSPSKILKGWNYQTKKLEIFKYNGIDRIDSTQGYELGNCVPCCWRCNMMKSNMSYKNFKKHIKKIYHYWAGRGDVL